MFFLTRFFWQLLPSLDIYSWTEEDVYFWILQLLDKGDTGCCMKGYAELFKNHHITGRRLLLLTEQDMKDIGIQSKGHIIHLKTEIEKLTLDYLNLFHFPPLIKGDDSEEEDVGEKILNLDLLFGYHLKPGKGSQDSKWKMYMEVDGDDVALTYIKDITFNTNRQDTDVIKITKPPYLMEKWIVGLSENQIVECTVTYENDVKAPKTTKHNHTITRNTLNTEVKEVVLVIQTVSTNTENKFQSRCNSNIRQQWFNALKLRKIPASDSPQYSAVLPPNHTTSNSTTLPHFLMLFANQDTYAAAVRRVQSSNIYHITTTLAQSKQSSIPISTTPGLSSRLSAVHLSSVGSSLSSTTSNSILERDQINSRQSSGYHSNDSKDFLFNKTTSPEGLNHRSRKGVSPTFIPSSGTVDKVKGSGRERSKSSPLRHYSGCQSSERRFAQSIRSNHAKSWGPDRNLQKQFQQHLDTASTVPEVPAASANNIKDTGEDRQSKPNEGEWIKVERHRKSPKNDCFKVSRGRGRGRGTGRSRLY
uniref:mitogen-activated protein kinase kinase kinase 20-like n=1 Tax=Pristiophorus japonicus TaxID=55135 RepID=UPI00398E79DF